MRPSFKSVSVFLVCLGLSACATVPQPQLGEQAVPFVLERDLRGRTDGQGVFRNTITGSERRFQVVLQGDWKAPTLRLREDFAFNDGERDTKTWVLTKKDATHYIGTREDVIGEAKGVVLPSGALRLSYTAEVGQNRTRVQFEDILEKRSDGVVLNRAIVSKFGIPVGTVDLEIVK
jgi:Protein of unknown function (DUF3833)